jgi:hypothetical protein
MELVSINENNIDLMDKVLSKNFDTKITDNNKRLFTTVGTIENEPVSIGYIFKEDNMYYIDYLIVEEYKTDIITKQLINTLQKEAINRYNVKEIYYRSNKNNEFYLNQTVFQGKFEFESVMENEVVLKFTVGNEINVSLALSDVFDTLSKLEISTSYKKDKEKVKMYNEVFSKLEPFMDGNTEYHYNVLKEINYKISSLKNKKEKTIEEYDYLELLEDRVYRAKMKIDTILLSKRPSINLTKNSNEKIFLSSNLSLTDIINNNGLVRYLTTVYDEIYYPVKNDYIELVNILYKDEPNLKLVPVRDFDELFTLVLDQERIKEITNCNDITVLTCSRYPTFSDLKEPEFIHSSTIKSYDSIKVDIENFWSSFHIPDTQISIQLYQVLLQNGIDNYVFVHNNTTTGKCFDISRVESEIGKTKDEILYINPRQNEYSSGHPFYAIADIFVNRSLIDYKQVLIHATYLYITNSSLLAMATHLPLDSYNFYYVGTQDLSFLHDETSKYSYYESDFRKFIQLQP